MDTRDIFKKLTFGVQFSNKDSKKERKAPLQKTETENELPTHENGVEADQSAPPVKLEANEQYENVIKTWKTSGENPTPKRKKRKRNEEEQRQEEVRHYRNVQKITAVGKRIPDPARSLEDFKIDADLLENLKKSGYVEPTTIQKQTVPIMLENRNVLAWAPTGSGKTVSFLIPIIQQLRGPEKKGFRALILCPTRELAKQTQRECVRLASGRDLRVHVIGKIGNDLSKSPYTLKKGKNFDILIATPNRLCYLLKQDPPALSLKNVQWLVVDEADRLFEDGKRGFREQFNKVVEACAKEDKKIAMFSATFMPVVAKWCKRNMDGLIRVTVGKRNAATDQVDQELLFVGDEYGKTLAIQDLIQKGFLPPALIFVQSKDRAQQLFSKLIGNVRLGEKVDAIHSDRTQSQRDATVEKFRHGKIWVLICTELMAHGMDFKAVNLVINYDFPQSATSYVHRIGRAGRAGRKGKAVTFFTKDDVVNLRSIAHIIKDAGGEVPEYMMTMKKKSKNEKKKLLRQAPRRADIIVKLKKARSRKSKKNSEKASDEQPMMSESDIEGEDL